MGSDAPGSFATLTHAHLRAAQGDVLGAVRILRVILEVQPGHEDAREMLLRIESRVGVVHREFEEEAEQPVSSATAGGLARRFRGVLGARGGNRTTSRLSDWLERVLRNRGPRRVR